MTKLSALFLFSTLIFLGCSEQYDSPMALAKKINAEYEAYSSLSYNIDYRIKRYSDTEDTLKLFAKVDMIRDSEDSIFGGYLWIKQDSLERYYDTEYVYLIKHNSKVIVRFPKEESWVISGRIVGEVINNYFLKPEKLIRGAGSPDIFTSLVDQPLSGAKMRKWTYSYKDSDDGKGKVKNVWINKNDFLVSKMDFSVEMDGEFQYNHWDIKNRSLNNITAQDLKRLI